MGEFTHTKQHSESPSFVFTGLTRTDVSLGGDHAVIRLKRSKTDKYHDGVSIIVAATDSPVCPVRTLEQLQQLD